MGGCPRRIFKTEVSKRRNLSRIITIPMPAPTKGNSPAPAWHLGKCTQSSKAEPKVRLSHLMLLKEILPTLSFHQGCVL